MDSSKKFHSLAGKLFSFSHLKKAARNCMRRCSAPGADKQSWYKYRQNLNTNIQELSNNLKSNSWCPSEPRRVSFYDFRNKKIDLHIPNVKDRIVQRAILNSIEPVFETHVFEEFVSGFRPKRNRLTSIRQSIKYIEQHLVFVTDIDVEDVSGGVDVEAVINWIAEYVSDGTVLSLIRKVLSVTPSPLSFGSCLSPLLINVRLSPIDKLLKERSIVRFADNYCIFSSSLTQAEFHYREIRESLSLYGLKCSVPKSTIKCEVNAEDLFLIEG